MLDIRFDLFPALTTARLQLREITEADAEILYALRINPDVTRYLDREDDRDLAAVVKMIGEIRQAFKRGDGIHWAISRCGSNELIGVVCFWRIDKKNYRAELGYMLHPDFWRQGLMTEALRAVLDYGFRTMKLNSVEANTSVANTASQTVLLNCGFDQQAHFRENWYYNGTFSDSLIFCKLTDLK